MAVVCVRAVWRRLVRGPRLDLGARGLGRSGGASSELVAVESGVNSGWLREKGNVSRERVR